MSPTLYQNGNSTATPPPGKPNNNGVMFDDSRLDFGDDPFNRPLYKINQKEDVTYGPLPLPPSKGMRVPVNQDVEIRKGFIKEPKFDPKVHLNLEMPEFVRLLSTFEKAKYTPEVKYAGRGTDFAYTSPFSLLSEEGIKALLEIFKREDHRAGDPTSARGNKKTIRGLYYASKFIRDLQNCQELKDFFQKICGEELVPHPSFSNSPQVNVSFEGGTKGPVDHWHWDSVAYTGVVLLSDMTKIKGGNLEVAMCEKHKALETLAHGGHPPTETISYGKAGKMILAQGSEILHHVTPVLSDDVRISMIFGYAPANPFQPQKTILDTMRKLDTKHELGDYEYFREKCWQMRSCLDHYVNVVEYTNNGQELGPLLRSVASELIYCADVLENKLSDKFKVLDETTGKLAESFNRLSGKNGYEHHQ